MILKSTINAWLLKCKAKAINSVVTEMNDKILEYANHEPIIKIDMAYLLDVQKNFEALRKRYGTDFMLRANPRSYSPTTMCYFDGILALAMAYLSEEKNTEVLEEIQALYKKRNMVQREYDNLIEEVKRIRKPEKAIRYIKELGFDTTTLVDDSGVVNKKYLFVCGDNKPDVAKKTE